MAVDWNESTVHEERCILATGTFWIGFGALAMIVSFAFFSMYVREDTVN
mgnify:CR=1 FL=1|jgi:hypothetical protein